MRAAWAAAALAAAALGWGGGQAGANGPRGGAGEAAVNGAKTAARRLETVGIYVQPAGAGQSHYYDFYKACGYNYLEFCEGGFGVRPDRLPAYYADMAAGIRDAKRRGLRVWILLLAGMKQWKGPEEGGGAGTFSALDGQLLEERLGFLRQAVRALHGADGFEFFAGDPGGDPQGRSTVQDCIAFSRRVRAIVREEAPKAGFAINLWAVAEWAGFPSPFTLDFWQKQVTLSKAVAAEPDLLGPDCGVIFSMDNYYRSLTLRCYDNAGLRADPYPLAPDVAALRARGIKPVHGWPYFLVDEIDDGFVAPNNVASGGQSMAEARYIRAVVDHGRAAGLDGLIANATFVAAEALNIYLFARMCRNAQLPPEAALDGFAGIIATDATKAALGQVLRFIENHSSWHYSLPPSARLADLPCPGLPDAAAAQALLAAVRPREQAAIPLPEPPAAYLARLERRLTEIAAGRLGGPGPLPAK